MPIRCTADDVRAVSETDTDNFPDTPEELTPFIRVASRLVDKLLMNAVDANGDPWHDDDSLKDIETWLAAHFYHILDPQLVREEVSTLRAVYQQEVKLGLSQTRYGDQAKVMDYSGILAAWDKQVTTSNVALRTSIRWLGKELN
jgi:hypothetical protein